MYAFTIGSIAAIINAVVAILQLVLPNALILALVATLSDSHTAVTWSVVARGIQSSHWPLLLRAASAATKGVQFSSTIITLLRPVALLLVAIAAIVTPLGLYEDIQASDELRLVDFVRQEDAGPFGRLTPPRSDLGFARACSDLGATPGAVSRYVFSWLRRSWSRHSGARLGSASQRLDSPLTSVFPTGTNTVITYSDDGNEFNATIVNDDYDRRIPERLAELYQSGLSSQPASVSSFFDIEWRWYNRHTRDNIQNNSYLVDSYYPIATVIGDDDIKSIEGVIVDTRDGGVGFRSHTVPATMDLPYGAEWEEDVMFLVPETECVDTNVTLEYAVPGEDDFLAKPVQHLVDQGGFTSIARQDPWDEGWYGDTQEDPQLQARAYRAAWTMNVLNMFYFDVSTPRTNLSTIDSELGRKFAVNNTLGGLSGQAGTLMSLAKLSLNPYGGLVDVPFAPQTFGNGSLVSNETYLSGSSGASQWANPYDVTTDNYTRADVGCLAFASGDWANMTNIQVKCGLVLGPANKTGGSDSPLVEPGSVWTRPVHMCASATKATIKTVRFAFNQTQGLGLEALAVRSIRVKEYRSWGEMPLWGIETPNMTLSSITPFWGLIGPQMKESSNLSTIQTDHLYVPASSSAIWQNMLQVDGGPDYMPGTAAPAVIWESAYAPQASTTGLQDLSGATSLALASTWRNLSASAAGTASIMNLIWTDLAANALIGTRGWLSPRDTLPANLQEGSLLQQRDESTTARGADRRVPVYAYQRVVRYRWVYGIPAALALLLTAIICFTALVAAVSGKGSIPRIRYYLNRLSAGRLLTALKSNTNDYDSDTKTWLDERGREPLTLPQSGLESKSAPEQYVVEAKRDADPWAPPSLLGSGPR